MALARARIPVIQAAMITTRVYAARVIRVSVVGAILATAVGAIPANADGAIRVSAGATAAEQGQAPGSDAAMPESSGAEPVLCMTRVT